MTESVLLPSQRPASPARPLPPPPRRIHFIGIGGVSMSGLARMLHAAGYQVSGSDATASAQTAALSAAGIPVVIGHHDHELALAADLVITTRAASANPEVAAARAAGGNLMPRGELLAAMTNAHRGIAVAGSHGKSTTTGMIVTVLGALGHDPSYMIGASLRQNGQSAAPGAGEWMVVEADEFDHAFLWLAPEIAVITNVDYDHPDIFPDQEAYDADFCQYVNNAAAGGTLVLAADDPGCQRLLARPDFTPQARVTTFGETAAADWRIGGNGTSWHVRAPDGMAIPLQLAIPGHHNLLNATTALAALSAVGCDPATAARVLAEFPGVGRRFDLVGEAAGITVIDDYAHHPREIRATLRAARERYPGHRLWAVFQPHTFSRTKALLDEFVTAFADADEVMILDVYAARETDSFGVNAATLRAALASGVHAATDPADAAATLATLVQPGDVVMTIGAGSVTEVGPALLRTRQLKNERGQERRGDNR